MLESDCGCTSGCSDIQDLPPADPPLKRMSLLGVAEAIPGMPLGMVNPIELMEWSGGHTSTPLSLGEVAVEPREESVGPQPPTLTHVPFNPGTPRTPDQSNPLSDELFATIYLSAGEECSWNEQIGCSIYRVTLKLAEPPVVYSVELIQAADDYGGRVEPPASPDGTKLAYVRRGAADRRGSDGASIPNDSRLYVRDLTSGALTRLSKGNNQMAEKDLTDGLPKWPAWFGEGFVLFSTQNGKDGGSSDLKRLMLGAAVLDDGVNVSTPGKRGLLGPGTSHSQRTGGFPTSFGDPDVREPSAVDLTDFFDMRVVTQGQSQEGDSLVPAKPRVSPAISLRSDVLTEEFELGQAFQNKNGSWTSEGSEVDLTECHHGAWSPFGQEIMCHGHKGATNYPESDAIVRMLYEYSQKADGEWGNQTLVIDPLDAGSLASALPAFEGLLTGASVLSFKYGQYCLKKGWVICTVFAADNEKRVLESRVVVVRRNRQAFWDVTTLVEETLNLKLGALSGYTGTCSAFTTAPIWRD